MPPLPKPSTAMPPAPDSRQACVLGIDLGTSSVKVVLVDCSGRLRAHSTAGYAVRSVSAGHAESWPDEWWAAIVASVREVVAAVGEQPVAVGLSGQMHGLVVCDQRGAALRAALLWADSRAESQLDAYRKLDSSALDRLANPLVAGMAGPLLAWVAEHEPDIYRRTVWALQPKDWLRARLTGRTAAEPSDASATLLYDVIGDRWDLQVATALGLDPGLLPPLLDCSGTAAGELAPEAADALGLAPGIPVAAGAGDTAAAALGSGIWRPSDVQLTVGTGAQVIRSLDRPESRAAFGVHLYRSARPTGWYQMAATIGAGLSLNWVCGIMNAGWAELYASLDHPFTGGDPLFVPHLSGERTPYLDPQLRGSWTRLSLADDRTSLLRSTLEGVAFSIREALDALLGAQRPTQLRLAGGGSQSPAWRQLLADVLETPLVAVDVPAASARGAALLGAHAAGLVTYADIYGPLAPRAHLVAEPGPDRVAFHSDRRLNFQHTVRLLRASSPDQASAPAPTDHEGNIG